ncbi:hypothetical protein AbraIFM66951_004822 [Aspergillus brasiliensis]|uniref:Uncharacterized protein n=1 Tax=Aspergillus brasiliensis TaxID=319629 RepID=A0A9W6DRX7_9EURO|nr:hypothetical protein AbraCBS73388_004471 [Aspergillus brasiliensis]GKZ51009.1 hypothetical protein AbraIFM66951_004822 [Aspergillus brasiliensis]
MATAVSTAHLPSHDVVTGRPPSSETKVLPSGRISYIWMLSDTERSHIAQMLNVDSKETLAKTKINNIVTYSFGTASEITLSGTYMKQDREICRTCGKYMGLDDLVHNAKYGSVHSPDFMLDILRNGPKSGETFPHIVFCSRCTTQFQALAWWDDPQNPGQVWKHDP